MAIKDRLVFEISPAEKEWVEGLVQAGGYGTKIQMLRALLDAESARVGYVARPGALARGKTIRKTRGEVPEDIARILAGEIK